MNFHQRRPSIPIQIRQDVTDFVDRLHDEYQAWDRAYQEELRDFLQRCAFLTVSLKDNGIFDQLSRHPYWKKSRQKPKQDGRGKWAVYAMSQPKTRESRKVVGKYGRVIDILLKQGVQPKDFAEVFKERHGINLIIEGRSKKANGGSAGARAIARRAKDEIDQDQEDQKQEDLDLDLDQINKYITPSNPDTFTTSEGKNLFVQTTKDQMDVVSHSGKILIYATVSWDRSSKKWLIITDDIIFHDD